MFGEYPIIINGEEAGKLCVTKDGILTAFDARCKDPGTLLRLSVYGEKEAYLGVMAPDGSGGVHLHKRLSRASLAGFPETIRFAGPAGQPIPAENVTDEEPGSVTPSEEAGTEEMALRTEDAEATTSAEETEPAPIRWRHGAGGALVGTREDVRYLAVPIKAGVVPVGGDFEKKRIADAEYAVFVIKSGT